MESKPSQFVPKVVNFLRHIFCLAVWRFSGLPITIRKRVRPLFRPLAALMFPRTPLYCETAASGLPTTSVFLPRTNNPSHSSYFLQNSPANGACQKSAEATVLQLNSIGNALESYIRKRLPKESVIFHQHYETRCPTLFLWIHLMEKKAVFCHMRLL